MRTKPEFGKVVVDEAIPFIKGALEPWFGDVVYRKGGAISPEDVRNASALIVRTRTKCGAPLLEGSLVEMVATATIGTDHIDADYCREHGIEVQSAPGCNSGAVRQYVFKALKALGLENGEGWTLGVAGVGHVGTKVAQAGREAGFRVIEYDPPRGLPATLDTLLSESDIITVHIPLWPENRDFIDSSLIERMKDGVILINASRGEVADEKALVDARCSKKISALVVDVWKNEPHINLRLLAAADIATPHIAGYSIQGKINGTQAAVRAVGRHFGIGALENFTVRGVEIPDSPYDIMADHKALKDNPLTFESLRNSYGYRNENL